MAELDGTDLYEKLTGEPPAPQQASETTPPAIPTEPQETEAATELPVEQAVTLKDYAEKHGLNLADLYGTINSAGQSLSEWTDATKAAGSLEADRDAFESERNSFRLEKARALQQIDEYHKLLEAGDTSDEGRQKMQALKQQTLEAETRALLHVIPEWQDAAQRTSDVEAMAGHWAQFGFSAEDLAAVDDHRMINYIRHNALRDARAEAALKTVKKATKKGNTAPSSGPPEAAKIDLAALIKGGEH